MKAKNAHDNGKKEFCKRTNNYRHQPGVESAYMIE